MALPPISGQAVQPQSTSTRSVADARAAQRAFFEAALNKAQAPATARAVEKPAAVMARPTAQTSSPVATSAAQAEATPSRQMRPGSLINIVV